jgi:hypothetical protein
VRGSYYDVLGIAQSSSDEDIRQRYLQLMRRYHPDYNRSPRAQVRAAEINEAYRHLANSALRASHNAQLASRRQDVVAARVPSYSRHPGGTALARYRRPSLFKRHAASAAFAALLAGTAVVGWQIQQSQPRNEGLPLAQADGLGAEGRREVAELMAASAVAARSMPQLSQEAVLRGASAFRKMDKETPGQARSFSKLCHARAAYDDGWSALDFCVAFDEAGFIDATGNRAATPAAAYFIERHDRAAHSYIYKVSNMDAIDHRLLRIKALVSAARTPPRSTVNRVLHGISKRSWKLADAAWEAVWPGSSTRAIERTAHDF